MEESMANELTCSRTDGIVSLIINRPEQRNMLSDEVLNGLYDQVLALEHDNSVHVVVLTATGREFFCGGVFTPLQMAELSPEQIRTRRRRANELFDRLEALPHPVIAAVNGRAQAGGFEMTLACDIRIAVSHATFAMPENTWGMFPGAGGPIRLPRLVGTGRAMDIILTGRDVNATEAFSIGFVERLVKSEDFDAEVQTLAEAIAASGPLGNRAVKKLIRASVETPVRLARAYSEALREPLASSADTAEGIAAHKEGRRPHFQGR
jgi:enoyl-CoA hydratase/carnithine racemase